MLMVNGCVYLDFLCFYLGARTDIYQILQNKIKIKTLIMELGVLGMWLSDGVFAKRV